MVIGLWVVVLAVVGSIYSAAGPHTSNNLSLPGTDSTEASKLLAADFPPQQNGKNPIVFGTKSGKVTDAANKQAIEQSYKAIRALPHVYSATNPFSQQGSGAISPNKRVAFISVLLKIGNAEITDGIAQSFLDAAEPARKAGMTVAASGQIGTVLSKPKTESSEVVGLTAAMIILAFTFGALVAMGMPIISAVLGLLLGLSLIGLLGHVTSVPDIAPTLATMIGLGVGIDYALFLVSRYRVERKEGNEIDESIATAVATSGTAIVFAGGTVVIALVSLLVAGIPLVTSLGYASAFAVLTAVAAAITLLPAVLGAVGRHIDSAHLPAFLLPKPKAADKGFWGAWARGVTNHPWRSIGITVLILLVLTIPFFSLELGQEDIGATPKSTTERQAYDLLASGFGPGYTGPLLVAVKLGTPATPGSTYEKQYKRAQNLQQQLENEQATGQAQAASLQSQAAGLEAEQASLEAQQAALETKAKHLGNEKTQLTTSAKKLKKQSKLIAQAESLIGEVKELAAEAATLSQQANQVIAQLQVNPTPELVRELKQIHQQEIALKQRANLLKAEFAALKAKATKAGGQAFALASQAASAARQAIALVQEKNQLQLAAANAKVEAAQLQTQQVQLEALQQQAQTQQQQAEKLKSTLTGDLTQAGGDDRGTDPRLVKLQDALEATIGVKLVSPPQINKSGDAAIFTVVSKSDPADDTTANLVKTIRAYVIPQAIVGTDLQAHVGGQTASYVDLASAISSKLALVIFTVIALGVAVLLMAVRSMLIPVQAAFANVLSVCAAFGVVTACFQYGWGLGLVGIDTSSGSDPIASFVPLIMFAVLFGLSMDYQVFLMSQIEHARARYPRNHKKAIAVGLATGARVISAAALIMIAVFGSFILNGDPTVKQFGVGLSVGVALAALTVLVLAPALLVLAGKTGTWWIPKWAVRVVPRIDIEGAGEANAATATPKRPPARSKKNSMKL
ncbi:MAG: putative drug exporter of the superfamily [Solirubrobacterales bacterium]|nr:putative drug exporter of the superfamily [Solirubrobacterales bacterium]